MPWPPSVPSGTRTNDTAEFDTHPTEHNQVNTALNDVVTKIDTTGVPKLFDTDVRIYRTATKTWTIDDGAGGRASVVNMGPINYVNPADDTAPALSATANTPTLGSISRLVWLKATSEYDRAGISWTDYLGRHRVSTAFHGRNKADETIHDAYEIKCSADPAGAAPAGMLTRFSIETDVDQGYAGFNFLTYLLLNQGYHTPATAFGVQFRGQRASGGSSAAIGNFTTLLDGSDNVTGFIDVYAPISTSAASLSMFRNTNSTSPSSPSFRIKKGNASNTDVFAVMCGGTTGQPTLTVYDSATQGFHIIAGTTTGLKIGTAVGEKIAFHGSTAVIQRAGAAQAAVATTGSTSTTPFGYTTAAQADAIVTLVNEIRATLVEKGLMKGAA